MAEGVCELLWMKIILDDLKIKYEAPMGLCVIVSLPSVLHTIQFNMTE